MSRRFFVPLIESDAIGANTENGSHPDGMNTRMKETDSVPGSGGEGGEEVVEGEEGAPNSVQYFPRPEYPSNVYSIPHYPYYYYSPLVHQGWGGQYPWVQYPFHPLQTDPHSGQSYGFATNTTLPSNIPTMTTSHCAMQVGMAMPQLSTPSVGLSESEPVLGNESLDTPDLPVVLDVENDPNKYHLSISDIDDSRKSTSFEIDGPNLTELPQTNHMVLKSSSSSGTPTPLNNSSTVTNLADKESNESILRRQFIHNLISSLNVERSPSSIEDRTKPHVRGSESPHGNQSLSKTVSSSDLSSSSLQGRLSGGHTSVSPNAESSHLAAVDPISSYASSPSTHNPMLVDSPMVDHEGITNSLSLQDAFLQRNQKFVERSRKRLSNVEIRAKERKTGMTPPTHHQRRHVSFSCPLIKSIDRNNDSPNRAKG